MDRIQHVWLYTFCFCTLLLVMGCGSNSVQTAGTTAPITNPSPPPSSTGPSSVTEPSVYVVGSSVLVFPQTANGAIAATLEIPGGQVSLDGAGNVYVLAGSSINEYSANSLNGTPTRSLPVGPGTAVTAVEDVMASSSGEIFVSDGIGIAVFSPTATGIAAPLRYILGPAQQTGGRNPSFSPGLITVDSFDETYAVNTFDSTIVVFGPTDTGNVAPARTISGPLTRISGSDNYITGMATDKAGNLYVLCVCMRTDGTGGYDFGVFEFDPAANGNVAPTQLVTAHEMYPYFFNDSVSVSADGNLWVSAGTARGMPTVFVFSLSSSGRFTPSRSITLDGWTSTDLSRIATH